MLAGEGHAVRGDDLRYCVLTARNTIILLLVIWTVGQAFQFALDPRGWGLLLLAAGAGIAVFLGIAAGLSTHAEIQLLESELNRERREIAEHLDDEREEVRALYAAKGLTDPLLTQVVEVLCADEDRLLKVMMEEELGLFVQERNHPIIVGLANSAAAMLSCVIVVVPAAALPMSRAPHGFPFVLLAAISLFGGIMARLTSQPMIPLAARWLGMGAVTFGVVHFIAAWAATSGGL